MSKNLKKIKREVKVSSRPIVAHIYRFLTSHIICVQEIPSNREFFTLKCRATQKSSLLHVSFCQKSCNMSSNVVEHDILQRHLHELSENFHSAWVWMSWGMTFFTNQLPCASKVSSNFKFSSIWSSYFAIKPQLSSICKINSL